MKLDKTRYYDPSSALGSGCPVNIITGARSFGKTYAFKKYCIRKFISDGWTWCYLRTFDSQIKEMLNKGSDAFFSDIMNNDEFPGWRFRTRGRNMEAGKVIGTGFDVEPDIEWHVMGQLMSLTKYDTYKGISAATCHTLVFDEFIKEQRFPPYPGACVEMLMNIWETLDRRENRVRLFLLANTADLVNPYFVTWGITPPPLGKKCKVRVGRAFAYVENAYSRAFAESASESDIGLFTAGSAYDRYAVSNEYKALTGTFVAERPKRCVPQSSIKFRDEWFGVWCALDTGDLYICPGECNSSIRIVLTKQDLTPNLYMIEKSSPYLKSLERMWRYGQMWFENDGLRERFMDVLTLCGVR